jgi:hypothetical protein
MSGQRSDRLLRNMRRFPLQLFDNRTPLTLQFGSPLRRFGGSIADERRMRIDLDQTGRPHFKCVKGTTAKSFYCTSTRTI